MVRVEKRLEEEGEIPRRGKILYLRDYNFFKWGDMLFVSIMDLAIVWVLVDGWQFRLQFPEVVMVISSVLVTLSWAATWHDKWMGENHRPDSCYPHVGEVSLLGKIHLVYFGTQYFLGFMGIWMMGYMAVGVRPWSWIVALGLMAAVVYFVTLASDFVAGRFKKPNILV